MKTIGVGVLGFGFMGKTHTYAHHTIPLYYNPLPIRCRLKAVCEVTPELARTAMETGQFERCTTDPQEIIEADDIDLVHICTPNQEHFPALAAAIRAGKHIYVDKPVTAGLDEADKLAGMLKDYGAKAQVALQYRFFPATLSAKQLIDEGFLGPIAHFRGCYLHSGSVDPNKPVNWKSTAAAGGGVIRDLGSHILDLLNYLIGPFEAVHCTSRIWASERPSLDEPGTMMKIDVEDAAVMLLRSADGAVGCVEASKIATGAEDELRFEIHGRNGAMRFNLMQPNYLEIYDCRQSEGDLGGRRGWQQIAAVQKYSAPGGKFPNPKFSLGWIRSHVHGLYGFLECIAADRQPCPSLTDGLYLQRLLEAVRASADKRDWVNLPRPS
ncbi:MAG TPA: Gfo/Idh/MocA family oxidoreductase [Phycisphaerae bacterium]|nr:Gfo/Idh/MocA family oxidoreductase [Phycisphaerae bacterium]